MKENFNIVVTKHNTRGNKGKECSFQWLNGIAYASRGEDYDANLFELRNYNDVLAKWVEENSLRHWAMSKFPKKIWDKMMKNLVESYNAWLKNERHHSICTFFKDHVIKLGGLLVKHKDESLKWKGSIGPKIEDKVLLNITKGEGYVVNPYPNSNFGVSIDKVFVVTNLVNRTCTCMARQMSRLPCEHACAIIQSIGKNSADFFNEWFTLPKQEIIYSGNFCGIEMHDMPTIGDDGLVRSLRGDIIFGLNPPRTKRSPGRPREKRIEFQFQDKKIVYFFQCNMAGHNRVTCRNPLP